MVNNAADEVQFAAQQLLEGPGGHGRFWATVASDEGEFQTIIHFAFNNHTHQCIASNGFLFPGETSIAWQRSISQDDRFYLPFTPDDDSSDGLDAGAQWTVTQSPHGYAATFISVAHWLRGGIVTAAQHPEPRSDTNLRYTSTVSINKAIGHADPRIRDDIRGAADEAGLASDELTIETQLNNRNLVLAEYRVDAERTVAVEFFNLDDAPDIPIPTEAEQVPIEAWFSLLESQDE